MPSIYHGKKEGASLEVSLLSPWRCHCAVHTVFRAVSGAVGALSGWRSSPAGIILIPVPKGVVCTEACRGGRGEEAAGVERSKAKLAGPWRVVWGTGREGGAWVLGLWGALRIG